MDSKRLLNTCYELNWKHALQAQVLNLFLQLVALHLKSVETRGRELHLGGRQASEESTQPLFHLAPVFTTTP